MIFDTHAHLDDEQLVNQTDEIVAEAAKHHVTRILTVATTLASSGQAIRLAESYDEIYAAVGIHPNSCHEATIEQLEEIARLTEHAKVVAIGETGLDDYWDFCPLDRQRDFFERQIRLSHQTGLPFIVHMRDCEPQMMETLSSNLDQGQLNGIMHSYTGGPEAAQQCLKWGMHVSFAGMVTYKKNDELRKLAAMVPDDRLLVETDSPYLSPHPKRSQRPNTPALVRYTVECLAETRATTVDALANQTYENAMRLFGLTNQCS